MEEWDRKSIFELIEHYKQYPCLWDPTIDDYKNHILKEECWQDIATKMNRPAEEIRRKTSSLHAIYRHERLRMWQRQAALGIKPGTNLNGQGKSKWYCWDKLSFLLPRYVSRARKAIQVVPPLKEKAETDKQATIPEVSEKKKKKPPHTILLMPATQKDVKSNIKENFDDCNIDHEYAIKEENDGTTSKLRDMSAVFADYVATKHRKYSAYTKSTVEHLISNVLYEADLGNYDNIQLTDTSGEQQQIIVVDESGNEWTATTTQT